MKFRLNCQLIQKEIETRIIHAYETTRVTANDKGERVHRTVHFYRYSRDGMKQRTNAGNVAPVERYIMSS